MLLLSAFLNTIQEIIQTSRSSKTSTNFMRTYSFSIFLLIVEYTSYFLSIQPLTTLTQLSFKAWSFYTNPNTYLYFNSRIGQFSSKIPPKKYSKKEGECCHPQYYIVKPSYISTFPLVSIQVAICTHTEIPSEKN